MKLLQRQVLNQVLSQVPNQVLSQWLRRHGVLLISLLCGVGLYLVQLGHTGLADETPPLFAASARAMAETGDWLTPRVNGLPRYDKPPLVYWLMGLGYLVPGQELWNPLGTWAARLPSALATIAVMLLLAATLQRWPQAEHAGSSRAVSRAVGLGALTAALAFGLSPLNLIWGRLAVSDALFSALVASSLLLFWRTQAARQLPTTRAHGATNGATPRTRQHWQGWWHGWLVLGLAVLAKGPVAVVLAGLTLTAFGLSQGELRTLWRGLRGLRGLGLTALVSLPWYGAELAVEGQAYWRSFFGYHNLQRFSAVVNDHSQPWWFFGAILVAASLPASPLLLLGLGRQLAARARGSSSRAPAAEASLGRFAACWLLVVLGFFTVAATKLPSYWLPATPAAAILIGLAAARPGRGWGVAWAATLLLGAVIAVGLALAPLWFPLINDPELPGLAALVLATNFMQRAALCFGLATTLALLLLLLAPHGLLAPHSLLERHGSRPRGASEAGPGTAALLALQLPMVVFVLSALQPLWGLGDGLRGLPVRQMAAAVRAQRQGQESLAMVGVLKPSLHYYSRQVVLYEGVEPADLANLADRLSHERRRGQSPSTSTAQPTALVVIDARTATLPHWQGLEPTELARFGIYRLWRIERSRLEQRATQLASRNIKPNWRQPRPERY